MQPLTPRFQFIPCNRKFSLPYIIIEQAPQPTWRKVGILHRGICCAIVFVQ